MAYLCIKKVSLAGKKYAPGETIPESAFLGGRADKLVAYGYIKPTGTETAKPAEKAAEKTESKPAQKKATQSTASKEKNEAGDHTEK